MGPILGLAMAFTADVETQDGLVAVQGANDGSAALPTENNPPNAIGVFTEARWATEYVSVQMDGIKYVAAGGVCTRGSKAAILDGGMVQNVATNATPVQQPYLGTFLESKAAPSGGFTNMVLVLIQPGFVTQ